MSWDSKVLWSEGLFLQPQHFQQHDRYVEALVAGLASRMLPYTWGVSALEIDREALKTGQFAIKSCAGLTPDGTLFRVPDAETHPPAMDVPSTIKDCVVYLSVPKRQQGATEVDLSGAELSATRFRPDEQVVRDTIGSGGEVRLGVGKLRLQFALEVDDTEGRVKIPIARIIEVRPDQEIILDGSFIPAVLDVRAASVLSDFLTELEGLLNHRITALTGRLTQSGSLRGTAETQDFLLLQVLNRYLPLIRHLSQIENVHPERMFSELLMLMGELSSFMASNRTSPVMRSYQHHNLAGCFAPVIRELRTYFSAVLETAATSIALVPKKFGISVGLIADRKLLGSSDFVLSVGADKPEEYIRRHFAGHAKIGPVEEIRTLVNSALVGIDLTPQPTVPRQIPYSSDKVYFKLDSASTFWKSMQKSGGIAVHVSGEYPGLEMELWAIRRQ